MTYLRGLYTVSISTTGDGDGELLLEKKWDATLVFTIEIV